MTVDVEKPLSLDQISAADARIACSPSAVVSLYRGASATKADTRRAGKPPFAGPLACEGEKDCEPKHPEKGLWPFCGISGIDREVAAPGKGGDRYLPGRAALGPGRALLGQQALGGKIGRAHV